MKKMIFWKVKPSFFVGGNMCNEYELLNDNKTVRVSANGGRYHFLIDKDDVEKVKKYNWHVYLNKFSGKGYLFVQNSKMGNLYRYLLADNDLKGKTVDHINLDTLDNRKSNLRICSHRANNCNKGLQSNNTSGVAGVRYYEKKKKYQARIKVLGKIVMLGYYKTFIEAVQARNVAMQCMWGEYGRYNDVSEASQEIKDKVINKCRAFAEYSLNKAFLINGTI